MSPSNSDLDIFVRDALARAVPRERIRLALAAAGWHDDEIASALDRWADSDLPVPVPRRRPYLSAREAFLYLVLFATLYVVAFNAGSVLFTIIQWHWPDAARPEGGPRVAPAQARFGTAALVIAFPIFLFVSRLIGRAIAIDPDKRGSKIRKWLTYLTLFIAALVLIGDLIALVAGVLSGELGTRFVLKVAVVFGIAGIVFGHYLGDLRREEGESAGSATRSVLARIGAFATMIVIVAGLVFAGSPRVERRRQLDQHRVQDLMAIAGAIDVYAAETQRLPGSLEEIARFRHAHVNAIRDPERGESYEYRALDSLRYELCARFALPETTGIAEPAWDGSRFWSHGAGRSCFTLTAAPGKTRP